MVQPLSKPRTAFGRAFRPKSPRPRVAGSLGSLNQRQVAATSQCRNVYSKPSQIRFGFRPMAEYDQQFGLKSRAARLRHPGELASPYFFLKNHTEWHNA